MGLPELSARIRSIREKKVVQFGTFPSLTEILIPHLSKIHDFVRSSMSSLAWVAICVYFYVP